MSSVGSTLSKPVRGIAQSQLFTIFRIKELRNKNIYPAITANNSKATMFVILIIGLTAGPAVSL